MKADELFWENVRRASTRSFWSAFAVIAGGMFILFIRGMTIGMGEQEYVGISIQGNLATVGAFYPGTVHAELYADYSQSDIDDSGFFHQYAPLSAKGKETAGGAGAEARK